MTPSGDAARSRLVLDNPALQRRYAYHGWGLLILPAVGTLLAIHDALGHGVEAIHVGLAFAFYTVSLMGITLGYHRLWSHGAFKGIPALEIVLGICASMAAQGPLVYWAANHRRHHAFSDKELDVHSPHLHGGTWWGKVKGFVHSQVTWPTVAAPTNTFHFTPDLMKDPVAQWLNRTYSIWVLAGLALPAVIGFAFGGTLRGAWLGLLWGGFVRLFVAFHATSTVNSICHMLGSRPYATRDDSRNNILVALATFGEGWHNNHHAFPWSARLGLRPSELDLGALVLKLTTALGWTSDVRVPAREQMTTSRRRTATSKLGVP